MTEANTHATNQKKMPTNGPTSDELSDRYERTDPTDGTAVLAMDLLRGLRRSLRTRTASSFDL